MMSKLPSRIATAVVCAAVLAAAPVSWAQTPVFVLKWGSPGGGDGQFSLPGPHAVDAYHTSGGGYFASIFFAGMIVTVTPLAVGAVFARVIFRMNPLMVLGGIAGAQTCTPGLNALREASGSNIGALAYTVPYALNNILLTIWGPVVVAIVHAIRT